MRWDHVDLERGLLNLADKQDRGKDRSISILRLENSCLPSPDWKAIPS